MIVPKEIAPIDYNKNTNDFIFTLDNFLLFINYETETFSLQRPDNIAYNESFDILKSPPKWFDDIEFGVVDWVKKAIKWNDQTFRNDRHLVKTSVEVDEIVYHVEFNTKTNDLSIEIPSKTIISHPNSLFYDFPEFQFMDNGELITLLTAEIFYKAQGLDVKPSDRRKFYAPIAFQPKKISTSQYNYKFEYKLDYDLILLEIPTRKIHINMLTIEWGSTELTKMHDGKMIDAIRNVVHDKNQSTE